MPCGKWVFWGEGGRGQHSRFAWDLRFMGFARFSPVCEYAPAGDNYLHGLVPSTFPPAAKIRRRRPRLRTGRPSAERRAGGPVLAFETWGSRKSSLERFSFGCRVRRGPGNPRNRWPGGRRYLFLQRPETLSQAGDPLYTNMQNALEFPDLKIQTSRATHPVRSDSFRLIMRWPRVRQSMGSGLVLSWSLGRFHEDQHGARIPGQYRGDAASEGSHSRHAPRPPGRHLLSSAGVHTSLRVEARALCRVERGGCAPDFEARTQRGRDSRRFSILAKEAP